MVGAQRGDSRADDVRETRVPSRVRQARERGLRILQVGTVDEGGGAAAVSGGLMRGYRARGCQVWQAVGRKCGNDPDVFVLPDDRRLPYRVTGYARAQRGLNSLAGRYPRRGWGRASRSLRLLAHPGAAWDQMRGREDFTFPGTHDLLDLVDGSPDIVQCHNLHGDYFDPRALQRISERVPTMLTLHDMWLLTGHCAYSLECGRWETGCGRCPDLTLEPAIRRDATAENWRRKQAIYAGSQLFVATPSRWLMDKVERSILAPGLRASRVIPNGVDLEIFHPSDRRAARVALGIPIDSTVVLLTTGSAGSMWKDDATLLAVMEEIAQRAEGVVPLFIALGRESLVSQGSGARVRSVPFQSDARVVAQYYQAADIYLHAARADNSPLSVLEAMACGAVVVATAVGGIPEQIRSLDIEALDMTSDACAGGATGVLVPPGAPGAMANAVLALQANPTARQMLRDNALRDVRARFSLDQQVETYLAWFHEIVEERKSASRTFVAPLPS